MSKKLELKLLLDMVDKVTGPLKKIREASGGVSGELEATRDKLKELNKQSAQIDGFKKQQKAMQSTASTLVDAQAKVKLMQAQMKALGGEASNKMRTDFRKANEAVRDLSRTLEKQRTGLGEHRQKLRDSGIDTGKLGDAQKDLKEKIQQTTDVMELQRKKLDAVSRKQKCLNDAGASYQKAKALQGDLAGKGAGMVATGAAIGAASAVPIIEYSKAETAATDLRVAMMGAGGVVRKEFAEINALANQLGNKLPGTTADFQNMMTTLLKQDMTPKAILGGLGEASAFLAVQVKMPFNEAAEFAAKLQDATGTSEKDMMKLMDTIQRMDGLGVTTNNMSQSFSKMSSALPILRKTGLEAVELLSPLTVMADQASIAGEVAGNAYAKMFRLSMNKTKVAKANEMLEERGIKLDFTDGKGEFAGLDNMFKQLEKIKGLSTEDRLPILSQIFGDDGDTLTVLNLMTDKGIAGYRETAAKMKAQASLQLRVNEQLNTLANLWDATTGTFSNALVNVGEAVAPELKQLVNWLGEMAEKLGTWVKANPELTGTLFKAAMAVGALAVAGGTLTLMLAGILGPLAMIKYSAEILGIKSLPLVGSAITKLGGAFSWILGGIKALTIALFTTPIGWLILGITALIGAGYLLVTHWDTVKAWMSDFWQTIKSLAGEGIEAVKSYFNGLPEPIKAVLSSIWETMKTVFSWSPIGLIVNNFDDIVSFLTGLPAKFSSLGEMTMDGLVKGITGKLTEVKETITNAASSAIGWFKDVLGIASPSKVFAVMGDQTMQGLTVGLNRSQQDPLNEVNKLSKQMAGTAFVLGISALPAAAMPNDITNLPSPAPIVQHREIVEQLSPAKLSQPEDIMRQVRDEYLGASLQAIPDQTRTIRDEYQVAEYLPNSSVPDAIRLVKEGELPARKPKSDDLLPDDNGLTHSTTPDRLGVFAQRQAPQQQTVHIDAGIHAPITVYATAGMDAQDVAQLIAIELEKRERAQQARLRSSLKDLN
ncbi:MAG: phage tail tape measure protein [Shewanella xiamenensis]|nr:phage tail tape measure protein [Shewanella xiamenensis]